MVSGASCRQKRRKRQRSQGTALKAIAVEPWQYDKVKAVATKNGTHMSIVVGQLIDKFVDRYDDKDD